MLSASRSPGKALEDQRVLARFNLGFGDPGDFGARRKHCDRADAGTDRDIGGESGCEGGGDEKQGCETGLHVVPPIGPLANGKSLCKPPYGEFGAALRQNANAFA